MKLNFSVSLDMESAGTNFNTHSMVKTVGFLAHLIVSDGTKEIILNRAKINYVPAFLWFYAIIINKTSQ